MSLLQFCEGVPDRQAVEWLGYHSGWCWALNRPLGEQAFHSTVLVNFRQRLIEHEQSALAFSTVLAGLVAAGLVNPRGPQRVDATQIMGLVSRMSRLEKVRETLRLALQELDKTSAPFGRPTFWNELLVLLARGLLRANFGVIACWFSHIVGGCSRFWLTRQQLMSSHELRGPFVANGRPFLIARAAARRAAGRQLDFVHSPGSDV